MQRTRLGEYERLMDELELIHDVKMAEGQLAAGEGVDHHEARERILARFSR